ncbi:MAG: hypothetical protein AAB152_12510 [Candidatus Coatesbacteria bacterium]
MGPWFAANALRSGAALLVCLLVLGVSAGWGERILRLAVAPGGKRTGSLRMTAPFLGYALLSLLVFGIAATGLCSPAVITGSAALAVVCSWRGLAGLAAGGWRCIRTAFREAPVPTMGFAWLVLIILPRLLLPEVNDDCLTYHLELPRQLLLRHRLPDLPGYWAWHHPLLADYPNVLAVGAGVDAAVRMTGVALAWWGALTCLRALVPGLAGGWMALLGVVALVVPFGHWVLFTAKNDAAACGFLLAAAAACLEAGVWSRGPSRVGAATCAAVLAGCAVAAKYTHGPVVVVGAALALARARGLVPGTWLFRFVLAAMPITPWLAWSWIRHNDPLHPFGASTLPGWFGIGGNGEAIRVELAGMLGGSPGRFRSMIDAAALLVREAYPALAVAPLLVVRSEPAAWWAVWTVLGGTGLAAAVAPGGPAQLPRYIYAGAVVLNLMAAACVLRRVGRAATEPRGLRGTSASMAALALTAVLSFFVCRVHPLVKWQQDDAGGLGRSYLAGHLEAESYRRALMGSYGRILPGLEDSIRAGGRGRVLVVGGYYWGIPAPVIADDVGWSPVRHVVAGAGAGRVAIRFRQLDVRWILYDAEWGAWARTVASPFPWGDRELRAYADFASSRFRVLRFTEYVKPAFGMQWLYELAPHAPAPRVAVLPGIDAAFGPATMASLRGDREAALREFRRLHTLLPDVGMTYVALGDALVKAGQTREGMAYLRVAAADGLIRFR